MTKRYNLLAVVTTLGLLACGVQAANPPANPDELAAWVEKRMETWQPTKTERLFDDIGWARNIREAEKLARAHQRPVFLFTYDGDNLAHYRC